MLQITIVCSAFVFVCTIYSQEKKVPKKTATQVFSTINLADEDLNDDTGEVANVSGVFSASDDIYLNTAGFEYQGVFYRVRGLDASQVTFLLNGVNQNRLYDDRPAWNNWGGIDGIYRSQDISEPLRASEKTLGRALGVNSLTTRASVYQKGTRISYARSNRSYQNKVSLNHSSAYKSWHYVLSASRRWGNEGYRTGTFYDANSLMFSVEKLINHKHSINASILYTPNKRAAAGIYTNEVYELKGNTYNGSWGYQNGKKRNARVREIKEPLFLLTHTYQNSNQTRWENSILYQTGFNAYSRIDYNRGVNPDAAYYQNLPSYWLSRNRIDYQNVYRYEQEFIRNGQLDWNGIYEANQEAAVNGNPNTYVLYNDKRVETRIQFNSNLTRKLSEKWHLNTSLDYRKTTAKNFAEVCDLLGGNGYLDVAIFTLAQSDVNRPNRIVKEGDKFKYHYDIVSTQLDYFVQTLWKGKKLEVSEALGATYVNHQRQGFYNFENSSDAQGKSAKINVFSVQGKVNALYKISGRNLLDIKSAYLQKPPNVRQIFPNARYSNSTLRNLRSENIFSNSLSYIRRGLNHTAKLTGYYNLQTNVTETSFYFAEGFGTDANDSPENQDLLDNNSLFVQEVLSNIKKKYWGLEFAASYNLSSSTTIKGVMGLGNYVYANNPNLLLHTENTPEAVELGFVQGEKNFGEADIKNRKLSVGPQQAFSFILEYTDPTYWRIKASLNHFRNNYVDIAPLQHTRNFTSEINGSAIQGVDHALALKFREQERLKNFTLVNLSGGKSWKIKNSYISVFWTVQNVLGINYQTGGFTSGRPANYSEQLKEYNREKPLFGNRYFVGNGRTFFTGLYYSF
ncbi:TonB-dependent receptor [Wenyingzhuangia sp. IMCC45533]